MCSRVCDETTASAVGRDAVDCARVFHDSHRRGKRKQDVYVDDGKCPTRGGNIHDHMTPLVTAIPTIVGFQILRRYGQQTFTAMVLAVFYAVPTLLGFMRPKRPLVIELRLVVYSLFYFIPLLSTKLRDSLPTG